MLIECVNCGFYIGSNENFCPDCGLSAPNAPVKFRSDDFDRPLMLKVAVIIAIVIFIGIALFRVREGSGDFSDLYGLVWLILLVSLVLSLFITLFLTYRSVKTERRQRFASTEAATNFRFIQDTILLRNHELKEKLRDFRGSAKRGIRLSENDGESKSPAKKNEFLNLIARYDLLNNKVDFARLQNKLLPIIEHRNALKSEEDFSENLDEILTEIELINLSLTDDFAAKVSENFQVEKRDFLAQINETEKLCEALLEWLSDAQPLQDNFEMPPLNDLTRQINGFDVQPTLKNFAESLDESERQFQRLKDNWQ